MNSSLYAESSAVLAYLLGEDGGAAVANYFATARRVIASELTFAEVDRTCALEARNAAPTLAILSLDRRVRENGKAFGFPLLPA